MNVYIFRKTKGKTQQVTKRRKKKRLQGVKKVQIQMIVMTVTVTQMMNMRYI